jgi:predicted SAM-dependent methyltransferase
MNRRPAPSQFVERLPLGRMLTKAWRSLPFGVREAFHKITNRLGIITKTLGFRIRRASVGIQGRIQLMSAAKRSPIKVIVGAGTQRQPGWISTEREYLNLLKPEDWERYFDVGSIDRIFAEHVLEHLTLEEGISAAHLCYQYLRPGGVMRIAVPDGFHPAPEYLARVAPRLEGPGGHKMLFTYQTLAELFESVGFETDLLEYFDEDGRFHRKDWDPQDGNVDRAYGKAFRQRRYLDDKGRELEYTSLIMDAAKPISS